MIKYRPHRASLEDAMSEYKEFDSYDELKVYVAEEWRKSIGTELFSADDVVIGSILGDDDRIGWKNVRHVCIKRLGKEDYIKMYGCPQCIAWCGE